MSGSINKSFKNLDVNACAKFSEMLYLYLQRTFIPIFIVFRRILHFSLFFLNVSHDLYHTKMIELMLQKLIGIIEFSNRRVIFKPKGDDTRG